ncbi:DUF3833 domain-containing protein [Thaumasiovibrio subtropicus]|uniref:DUF3833 domain-containing protein n=1 Tax=Thaumasiovibrio subtropicus TaxID=1891207 RepID=UPI000B35E6EA|nr:DUF3833 domain-containing protein [Thaumasiovibrio subtropicus]
MRKWLTLSSLLFLFGCSTAIDDYHQTNPDFDLFEYFEDEVKVWGMVQDYKGKQTRRFEATINGTIEGNTITLDEAFRFDDGEIQTRIWVIEDKGEGKYQGTANDVVGTAVGEAVGNALRWRYKLRVPVGDSEYVLSLDDWLYRQDEKHMFNRTSMRKWGIEVGELTLFFQKQ